MAEEELILAISDNPVIYDLLQGYRDPYLKSTHFLSITLANLSKVNRALTFVVKDCGSARWFL